jgi:iron complex outermembrane receptor protein
VFQYRVKDKQLTAGSGVDQHEPADQRRQGHRPGRRTGSQANLSDSLSDDPGRQLQRHRDQGRNLFVQYCGNYGNNPTHASGCTPTNAPGPFAGTSKIDGNPLPRAPKNQLNFTLKYSTDIANGEFYAYTDWTYRTGYNFFLYEAPEYTAKSLTEGGVRAGYKWATASTKWRCSAQHHRPSKSSSARSTSTT